MAGIFLSYRRDDVGLVASDVVDELRAQLDVPVFFDLQSIQAGADFRQTIDEALQRCDVVLVILGKDWYGPTERGTRRIDELDDVFRNEVLAAVETDARVIPVLVGIRGIDDKALVPLDVLGQKQWHQIRLGRKHADIESLVSTVKQVLYERRQARLAGNSARNINVEPYDGRLPPLEPESRTPLAPRSDTFSFNADLRLRVDAALATRRPLLVVGSVGSGRHSLAPYLARCLGWRYYEHTVMSRFKVQDLLYHFDDTRRLHDAQIKARMIPASAYVEPRALWWSFDRESAQTRGALGPEADELGRVADPSPENNDSPNAVLHISSLENANSNEIEDLFAVLGTQRFFVVETGMQVQARHSPLIILSAEGPRILERVELGRALVYEMPFPTVGELVRIAQAHFPDLEHEYIGTVADALQREEMEGNLRRHPQISDLLDLIQVLSSYRMETQGTNWRILLDALRLLD